MGGKFKVTINPKWCKNCLLYTSDILTAKEQGKIAAVLAIEGGEALEGDLGVLRMFHRLGVRSIGRCV